jgi:hypothetical protein
LARFEQSTCLDWCLLGAATGDDVLTLLSDRWSGARSYELQNLIRGSDIPTESKSEPSPVTPIMSVMLTFLLRVSGSSSPPAVEPSRPVRCRLVDELESYTVGGGCDCSALGLESFAPRT